MNTELERQTPRPEEEAEMAALVAVFKEHPEAFRALDEWHQKRFGHEGDCLGFLLANLSWIQKK